MSTHIFDDLRHTHASAWPLRIKAAQLTKELQTIGQGYHEAWERDERRAAIAELDRAAQAIAGLREKLERPVRQELTGLCLVPMRHIGPDGDGREWPCVLPAIHRLFDGEAETHLDQHGHQAAPLIRAATIREIQAVQDARERGEIE